MARTKPYTAIGIKRLKCFRCGKPALYQWNICSDNNTFRPLCPECDLEMNIMVIKFMKFSNPGRMINNYTEKLRSQLDYYDYKHSVLSLQYLPRKIRDKNRLAKLKLAYQKQKGD